MPSSIDASVGRSRRRLIIPNTRIPNSEFQIPNSEVSSSYIELHTASAFSFLQGASLPEALVDRAADLGYSALALLDRDGVYGAPRFHKAALAAGVRPIIGAELTVRAAEPGSSRAGEAGTAGYAGGAGPGRQPADS